PDERTHPAGVPERLQLAARGRVPQADVIVETTRSENFAIHGERGAVNVASMCQAWAAQASASSGRKRIAVPVPGCLLLFRPASLWLLIRRFRLHQGL